MNYHDEYLNIPENFKLDKNECCVCNNKFYLYYFRKNKDTSDLCEKIMTICKNNHYYKNKNYSKSGVKISNK
jgi:hypothetical protein